MKLFTYGLPVTMCSLVYIGLYPWPPLFDRPERTVRFLADVVLGPYSANLPARGEEQPGGARSDT